MNWFESIERLIERQTSRLYVNAMNYTTSYRNMTFKKKKIMLWVCQDWIEFSSQQALEVLTYVKSLVSTLYFSAFDIQANLLHFLCFALL